MQVKKFEAPTIQEALEVIKRELGPEAVILQTKKNKSGFGLMSKSSVEITAAISDRSMQKKSYVESRMDPEMKSDLTKMPATQQMELQEHYLQKRKEQMRRNEGKITTQRYADIDSEEVIKNTPAPSRGSGAMAGKLGPHPGFAGDMTMEEEVRHLKRMIEEMKNTQDSTFSQNTPISTSNLAQGSLSTPALQDTFESLILNGVDKRYALSLIRKVTFELGEEKSHHPDFVLDQLALEIMQSIQVRSPFVRAGENHEVSGPSIVALLGPTGVGKTTTVAKIASDALLKRNLRVGLINLDSYKVAAFDQLSTYAKILNVPFRSVATREDLQIALQDFQSLDLVLIDTAGRSQRDPDTLKEMQAILEGVPNLEAQLVLAVTTRDAELYDMATRFSIFKPQSLIISKLDEATLYGAIYNLQQKMKIPLSYFTTGQRVPEDIEEASRERVAALVMDI